MSITTKNMNKKRTLLIELNVLPELVNGKVAVLNTNNTYSLYHSFKDCTIANNFNPLDYCLVETDKYKGIGYSHTDDKERYLVRKQLNATINFRKGDKIHINSRRGIYEVVFSTYHNIVITCGKWQRQELPNHIIPINDFKCLAGGYHNNNF